MLIKGGDAPTSAGVAGPPPPPPPAVVPPSDAPAESTDKVDKSGLFAELNKGSAITSGKADDLEHITGSAECIGW